MKNKQREKLYQMQAQILQAVGQPIRLAIIDLLKDGEYCVCDIAKALGAERSNISRHLAVLSNSGIVQCRKRGVKMVYSLRTRCALEFFSCVTKILKQQLKQASTILEKV